MIALTIQKAPDGLWIVDLIVSGDKRVSTFMKQSWTSGASDSPDGVYEAIVRNVVPQLLTQPHLLEYARTA